MADKISAEAQQALIQTRQYIAWGQSPDDAVRNALTDVMGEKAPIDKAAAFMEEKGEISEAAFQAAMDKASG